MTFGPDGLRVIDTGSVANFGFIQTPEDLMNAFGECLGGKIPPAIVHAIVVVIPGHQHGDVTAEGLKFRLLCEIREGFPQFLQIMVEIRVPATINVAIDIVANEQEEVRVLAGHAVHGRIGKLFVMAGSDGDSRKRSVGIKAGIWRSDRQGAVRDRVVIALQSRCGRGGRFAGLDGRGTTTQKAQTGNQ